MNSVNLTGRLTKSVELRQSQNGTNVCVFDIAVKRPYSQETDFFKCVAWRKTAETICQYVNKGDMVGITGYIYTRKYTGKDNIEKTAIEISVSDVTFLSSKSQSGNSQPNTETSYQTGFVELQDDEGNEDDLPF